MARDPGPPLHEDWQNQDSLACFMLGVQLAKEDVAAGGPVPGWLCSGRGMMLAVNRPAALIDAAMTVQRWQRQFPAWMHYRMARHIAHQLGCYPAWDAIEDEIARRLLADETARVG